MILMKNAMMGAAGYVASGGSGELPTFDSCELFLYGNSGSGWEDHISQTSLALPSGLSFVGDSVYFNQTSTAYIDLGVFSSPALTVAIGVDPDSVATDLRLFGIFESTNGFIIWKDAGGSGNSWGFANMASNLGENDVAYYTGELQTVSYVTVDNTYVKSFIDGLARHTASVSKTRDKLSTYHIGKVEGLSPNYKGLVSFVGIWSRELTESENSELHTWNISR